MEKSTQKKTFIYILAGVAVLAATGASAYYVTQPREDQQVSAKASSAAQPAVATQQAQAPAQAQQQAVACDDGNIVGVATGAVAGGLLGNQIGSGSGKTVATIGGAAGGAMLGQRHIPTNGVTCR